MKEYSILQSKNKRFFLIACEVLQREIFYCAALSKSVVDVEMCSQGYHDLESKEMCRRLQERVDAVDGKGYDAILLGFALCSNGVIGLKARSIPLVIPRAHDCITLLLGSREKYEKMFNDCPGTYYLSSGWLERDTGNLEDLRKLSVMHKLGLDKSLDEMIAEYGEENGRYIYETLLSSLEQNYKKLIFINNKLGDEASYREITKIEAKKRGLEFEEIEGSLELIKRLIEGEWDKDDFLVVRPGYEITRGEEENIISCVDCSSVGGRIFL